MSVCGPKAHQLDKTHSVRFWTQSGPFQRWRLLHLMQINVVAKAIPHHFTLTETSALGVRNTVMWECRSNPVFSRPTGVKLLFG